MKHAKPEAAFQRNVIDACHLHGWRVAHFRPAQNGNGDWRTAVSGDGVGWPDLFAVNVSKRWAFAAELKAGANRVTDEQREWLVALELCGVPSFEWRPTDWEEIERVLTMGPQTVTA